MKLNAKLDFDVLAVEQEDTVHVLLDLAAPSARGTDKRPPATLQVVLDRSGSMNGPPLATALQAIDSLLGRLRPDDRFGLVCFDHEVEVPIAAGPVGDRTAARHALTGICPRGMTNLSSGYLRGVQEARRAGGANGATLVLLSDGHANEGLLEHDALGQVARGAAGQRIVTSTIGLGLGYDEDLLATISRDGAGNAHFAEQADAAGAALASEVDGLLEKVAQAVNLTVKPSKTHVSAVRVFNELSATPLPDGFMVELGDFHGDEAGRVLLEIDVPALAEQGLAQVCELELRWVDVRTMESRLATIPVNVNVVPGDAAAGRVADAEVTTELAFQRAQRAKREADEAIRDGDLRAARDSYLGAKSHLELIADEAPATMVSDISEEIEMLDQLSARVEYESVAARKMSMADRLCKSRRRR